MSAARTLRPSVRPVRRTLVLVAAIVAGVLTALAPVGRASAAYQWYDGSIQYSQTINCGIFGTPTAGPGIGAFVGAYADPQNNMPAAGQPYYVHIYAMAIGNPCAGQIIYMDLILPPGTTPSVTAQTPIQCLIDDQRVNGGGCPGQLVDAGGGRYKVNSTYTDRQGPWAMPFGRSVEFRVPVVSTQQPADQLKAEVVVIDGSQGAIQYLRPQAVIGVFGGGGGQTPVEPTIVTESPSTTFTATSWPTGIRSEVLLYPVGRGGSGWFELYNGPIGGGGTKVSEDGPVTIPPGQTNAYEVWADWTLPNGQLPAQIVKNTTYTGASATSRRTVPRSSALRSRSARRATRPMASSAAAPRSPAAAPSSPASSPARTPTSRSTAAPRRSSSSSTRCRSSRPPRRSTAPARSRCAPLRTNAC